MSDLGSKQIKCLKRIQSATDSYAGMYPGEPVDLVSRKVANRLRQLGHIEQFEPHNPVHKARLVITVSGREALDPGRNSNDVMTNEEAFGKDWEGQCENCGMSPTVRATGLCGPCTFGESDTLGGNW